MPASNQTHRLARNNRIEFYFLFLSFFAQTTEKMNSYHAPNSTSIYRYACIISTAVCIRNVYSDTISKYEICVE